MLTRDGPGHRSHAGLLVGLSALAASMGVVATGIAVVNTAPSLRVASGLTAFLLVGTPMVAGVIALRLPGADRFGYHLIAVGCATFLASLAAADSSLPYSLGRIGGWLIEPTLVYVVLAYPSGRLTGRWDRLAAGAACLVVAALLPNALLLERYPTPSVWTTCFADGCPVNAFMVLTREPGFVQATLRPAFELATVVLFLLVIGVLAVRIRRASPLLRRTLVPVRAAAVVHFGAYTTYVVARRAGLAPAQLQWWAWLVLLSVPLFAASFVAGLLWAGLYAARSLQRVTMGLDAAATPDQLRELIAGALSDPSVELFYPRPESGWSDAQDRPVALPDEDSDRCVIQIPLERAPVVAIAYDAALREQQVLVQAVGACVVTSLRQQRLTVALRSSLAEVEAARARTAAAGAAERRRIERDLHDGAQQQLVMLRINLELAAEQVEREPAGASEQLRALGEDIDRVLNEIRSLAAGIFPLLLGDAGLGEALAAASRRGPLRTAVETVGVGRYPLEIETAVYFCCLEALQNSTKHARGASCVTIRLVDDGKRLRLEVSDDGIGFDPDDGHPGSTGVTNMKDRLGDVGGHLWIESKPDSGTVVHGDVPIAGMSP